MLYTFFTVGFLAIISTTVYTNNLTTQQTEAELKEVTEKLSNENDSALNKIKTDKFNISHSVYEHRRLRNILTNETKLISYNAYVDPEVDKIWRQFLKEKNYRLKHNLKWTVAMNKDEAVTERGQKNISRRQSKQEKVLQKIKQMKGSMGNKYERYREPYWQSGEYVFLRTGSPATPLPWDERYKNGKDKPITQNPMEVFRDCDRTCNYYFKTYGQVCGHRYNTKLWINQYQTFDNICDMDHANCVNATVNWHPMYKGPCGELGPFFDMPSPGDDEVVNKILSRAKTLGNYSYTPPPYTDPTADPIEEELRKELAQAKKDAEKAKKPPKP